MSRLLLLVLFSGGFASAQHSFPLSKGDTWQYHSSDPFDKQLLRVTVERDSLAANGRTYQYVSGSLFTTTLLRIAGSRVYAISSTDTTEFLLFDLDANAGDTMSIQHNGQNTILLRSTSLDTTHQHRYWLFILYQGPPGSWYDFADWTIEDSLGLTYIIFEPGMSYYFTGAIINGDTIGTVTSVKSSIPHLIQQPELLPNYPNPFNPSTTIRYGLPSKSHVTLAVFNTLGQQVAQLVNGEEEAGYHQVRFDGSGLASGVYYYRLVAGSFTETKRLLLIR